MEGGTQRTGGTGGGTPVERPWVIDFAWSWDGMSLEEARAQAEQIAEYAESLGMTRIAGTVGLPREREANESFHFGSDEPFRNLTARTGSTAVADAIASGTGAHAQV